MDGSEYGSVCDPILEVFSFPFFSLSLFLLFWAFLLPTSPRFWPPKFLHSFSISDKQWRAQTQNLALGCSRSLWSLLKTLSSVIVKKVMVTNVWRTVTWELCSHIVHSFNKCKVNTYQQLPQNHIEKILHAVIVIIPRILQILMEYFLNK